MMKTISAGICTAIGAAATISLMAQTPTPQANTSPSTDHRVTVTGCLKPSPASADGAVAPGPTGTTGTATAPNATDSATATFVLSDATISPAASGATTESAAAAGTTSGSASQPPAQTYRLVANPAALSPHVGKKLELTGTIVDKSTSSSSTSAEQTPPGSGPILRVEAGKVLAASCQD
jgi:hypothetical protein